MVSLATTDGKCGISSYKSKGKKIVAVKETSSAFIYNSNSNISSAETTTHYRGWLLDKKGGLHKVWISGDKFSEIKVGNTYNLFELNGVEIILDFVVKRTENYSVSSTGVADVVIMFIVYLLYLLAMYFEVKLRNKDSAKKS